MLVKKDNEIKKLKNIPSKEENSGIESDSSDEFEEKKKVDSFQNID